MKTMQNSSTLNLLFFFFFFFFLKPSFSDPRISEAGLFCGAGKPSPGTNFIPTFVKEMESLSEGISRSQFATHFVNDSTTKTPIYGLAQCHGDLSHTDCLLCYAASRTRLPRCLPSVSARIFLDGCFLRYDNYSFFSEAVDDAIDAVNCSSGEGEGLGFERAVEDAVEKAAMAAERREGFGVSEREGVYGLAQCWKSLGERECRVCLEKAKTEIVKKCLGMRSREGRSLNAGCYLRYSTFKFSNHGGDETQNGMSDSVFIFSSNHNYRVFGDLN